MSQDLLPLLKQAGLGKIKRTSEGFAALCPFHDNTKTPAWTINSETGMWCCFNPECGETGNWQAFLIRVCGMPITEAAKYAMQDVGSLEIEDWSLPEYGSRHGKRDEVGMDEGILADFDRCPQVMLDRGFPKRFLRHYDVGYDAAGRRVTFPVRESSGSRRILGFAKRWTEEGQWPPYLNEGFEKLSTLYLLHTVEAGSPILITEGPTDALRARLNAAIWSSRDEYDTSTDPVLLQAMQNAVATLGGGIGGKPRKTADPWQARVLMKKRPETVILAFDNDVAGEFATAKSIKALREAGARAIKVLDFVSDDVGAMDIDDWEELFCSPSYLWLTHFSRNKPNKSASNNDRK